jgi:hypothetical protein
VKIGKPNRIFISSKNPATQGPIKFESSKRITNPAFAAGLVYALYSIGLAILHKRGKIKIGEKLTASSIIDSKFTGQILGLTKVGNMDAILPEISGRAWITGTHQHMLDPADPWPGGYRISDTWGV